MQVGSFERPRFNNYDARAEPVKYEVQDNGCFRCTNHARMPSGYYHITIRGKNIRLHRFIFESVYGPIPKGMSVCHSCDNPSCINPEHLFLGTIKDNMQDMLKKHRGAPRHGEHAGNHKLTLREALAIRESTEPPSILAKRYGVAKVTVDFIQQLRLWKNYMTSGIVE